MAEHAEQPANKLVRTEGTIKEEEIQDDGEQHSDSVAEGQMPSSGDMPVRPEDAEQILEVLELYVI